MNYENRSPDIDLVRAVQLKSRMDIDDRRSNLDRRSNDPEMMMTAQLAREFGHIALRHASDEISQDHYEQFQNLYIDKVMKHSANIDRDAIARDFSIWVDAMLPAAQADIYDAMVEQGVDELPDFDPPKVMSREMTSSSDKNLLKENIQLKEDNARLMNQSVNVLRQMRELRKQMASLRQEKDDLALAVGPVYHEASSNG